MRTSLETERLLLRELLPTDDVGMFELDSNPQVHIYLGNKPVTSIEQVREAIANIRQQYLENGIGRWAVILKETNEFIGWSGLKLEKNVNGYETFYDLGYRFIQKHWGKGYAYETAKAFVDFGFNDMKLEKINAYADFDNLASRRVLEKVGMHFVNAFDDEGTQEAWYEIKKSE
ncbi:RimJ/RimL family protein N-acetyltransferase [Flavobacterium endophyticum]|uniref:RimJ/RimL family protein N-acetyltransferase n=1 Tax=Flavobacterium endophyticum TaxID=1540163 RepID=A0A495MHR3_9FLAO|nr:GNAT family N-acetyltransferase [Flavobacterium endophyticum]RKS25514.1 RimJ/RimL family protein N-acetyltransferase [Flavobacterium endophyticum]